MIICISILVFTWFYFEDQRTFFDNWTCPKITDYAKTDEHLDLTNSEHLRFHEYLQGCFASHQFIGDKVH